VDFGLSAAAGFNPKNQQTYVSFYNGSSTLLYVMNDTTDRLINRFDIGTIRSPIQTMAVNPSTNNIYLIKDGSDNLTIIDGITGQPKGEIHVDKRPTAIDIYAEHNLKYIANSDSNTMISIIDGIKNEVLLGCSLTLYLLNQGTFTA
jgi:DNA-binding beta-propeller fold protein YncE